MDSDYKRLDGEESSYSADGGSRQKIGYENEPDYSTLKGAQAQEQGQPNQPASPRARAAETAREAESAATGAKQAASAATKAGSGDYLGASKDALGTASSFKNSVGGKKKDKNGMMSGNLKKAAPVIGVVLLVTLPLIAIGALLMMPFHLLENIKSGLNSLFGANATAAKESYAAMLEADSAAGGTLSDALAASQGYSGMDDESCAEWVIRTLVYEDCPEADGDPDIQAYYQQKALEAGTLAASATFAAVPPSGRVIKWTDRDRQVHIINSDNFSDYYDNNLEFNEAITRGSLAWTGTFSGWFDDVVRDLMARLQVTRDAFQTYYEEIDDQIQSAETYRKIIGAINDKDTLVHSSREKIILCNPKGFYRLDELILANDAGFITAELAPPNIQPNPPGSCTYVNPPTATASRHCYAVFYGTVYSHHVCTAVVIYDTTTSTIVDEELTKAKDQVRTYLPEMINTLYGSSSSSTPNDTCASLYGISYFSAIVSATRLQQAADFAAKALESIDKVRAGDGSESPIHQFSQHISNQNTYEYISDDGNLVVSDTDLPGLSSAGLSWITTHNPVDLNDPNVLKLSLEGIMKGFVLDTACNVSEFLGNKLFGLISLIAGLKSHLFSNGNNKPRFLSRHNTNDLVEDAISRAAFGLIFNPCTEPGGEDVGNCLALGSHYYLSKNHQLSGGSPASMEKLTQFANEQRHAIARHAELERGDRSPFDASSQYTFLGSIVNQIIPYAATLSNSNIFTSIGRILGNSINSLFPAASALQEDVLLGNIGNCYYLGGIGAVGDAFCVPYMINDIDPVIRNKTPYEVEEEVKELKGFELDKNGKILRDPRDGNPIINRQSNFARYITYCSYRYSTFGILDANILEDHRNFLESQQDPMNKAFIGFFGQLLTRFVKPERRDELELIHRESLLGWATGVFCVATDDDTNPNNVDYAPKSWNEETRYYQAYMTYQRINVNRGGYATNNSRTVIAEYESLRPRDNIPEGILARTAGMTTEDYVAAHNRIIYLALDKSSLGPAIAAAAKSSAPLQFRRSITPLADFLLDRALSINTMPSRRKQDTTA